MPRTRSDFCLGCGVFKTAQNTYWTNQHNGLRPRCKACTAAYHKEFGVAHPGRKDAKHLYYIFGLTPDDYDRLLEAQGGVCAICNGPETHNSRFSIDHDHTCCPGRKTCGYCIRGLLCRKCNTGIGSLDDSVAVLKSAINYLERNQTVLICPNDGFTIETAKKWLDLGYPLCPCGTTMELEVKGEE